MSRRTHADRGATESFSALLPDEVEDLAVAVLERAKQRELSIASAESCTGGMLASVLTDVQGSSSVFERGFVTYSDVAKCELLGLQIDHIERCGAVSKEVAIAMAEGALAHSHAGLAVATTGYADEGDVPGLVHFACAVTDRETRHQEERFGPIGRGPVRVESIRVALTMMDEAL